MRSIFDNRMILSKSEANTNKANGGDVVQELGALEHPSMSGLKKVIQKVTQHEGEEPPTGLHGGPREPRIRTLSKRCRLLPFPCQHPPRQPRRHQRVHQRQRVQLPAPSFSLWYLYWNFNENTPTQNHTPYFRRNSPCGDVRKAGYKTLFSHSQFHN